MLNFILEKELSHLERVAPLVSRGPLPFGYWHARVDSLGSTSNVPLRLRIERLRDMLFSLEREHAGS